MLSPASGSRLAPALRRRASIPPMLLHPPADSWPSYHGDYSGRRHSALSQITPENVGKLTSPGPFKLGQAQQIKCSPLLVDGVLYITVTDNVWAVDARSGHQLWHYTVSAQQGLSHRLARRLDV